MGIPTFFGEWVRKNIEPSMREGKPVKPDYLLIDANGLFHGVYDEINLRFNYNNNISVDLTKSQMDKLLVKDISEEIRRVIKYIEPKKGVYIAVDGIAPLAKVNQQRKRRFLSKDKVRVQLSPGTDLMNAIDREIRNYLGEYRELLDHELLVNYSSHKEMGEGEHKIMVWMHSLENVGDSTFLIHGMDADIIVRSYISKIKNIFIYHEPRKKVGSKKKYKPTSININMIREYFSEFLREKLGRDWDLVKNKEDFHRDLFFMLTLILGNDFIPKIPTLSHSVDINYFVGRMMNTMGRINHDLKKYYLNLISEVHIDREYPLEQHPFIISFNFLLLSIISDEERYFKSKFSNKKYLPEYVKDMLKNFKYEPNETGFNRFKKEWYTFAIGDFFHKTDDDANIYNELLHYIDANYDPKEESGWDSKDNYFSDKPLQRGKINVRDSYVIGIMERYISKDEQMKFTNFHRSESIKKLCKDYWYMCLWIIQYYFSEKGFRLDMYYSYPVAPLITELAEFRSMFGFSDGYKENNIKVNKDSRLDENLFKILPYNSNVFPSNLEVLTNPNSIISDMFPVKYNLHTVLSRASHEKDAIIPPIDTCRVREVIEAHVTN